MITPSTQDVGLVSGAFSFTFSLDADSDIVTARIDGGSPFYQLNFALADTSYEIEVTANMLYAIGGGSHTITLSGAGDTAAVSFEKEYTLPQVSFATNLGDKTAAFPVAYSIKNAASEHPSLVAYMDTASAENIIYQLADASMGNSFTVGEDVFGELDSGSHTIILVVANSAGSTTKNASFNKTADDGTYTGLKLGYSDDTWDGEAYPNRIYTEGTASYGGATYKTFTDETPYDTEGEAVTGGLLAAFSRGVQNAAASNLTKNIDGSYTETSANGTSTIAKADGGYVEVFTDKEGNTLTKNTYFNPDGSVSESISYRRASS